MVDSLLEEKKGRTPGSRQAARLTRTVLLGSVAAAVALYWLARSYGADADELLGYVGISLLFVGCFAVFGVLAGVVLRLLRRRR